MRFTAGMVVGAAGATVLTTKLRKRRQAAVAPAGTRRPGEVPLAPPPQSRPGSPPPLWSPADARPAEDPRPVERRRERGTVTASDDPADVFAVLAGAHRTLTANVGHLAGMPIADFAERLEARTAAEKVVMAASAHEWVEETVLWPEVRARLHDGEQLSQHGLDQELEARRLLHEMERRRPSDDGYGALVSKLSLALADHIDFEETIVWPALDAELTLAQRAAIGRDALAAMESAPTRPHPSGPATPGRHRRMGRMIAALDRVGDKASGRGRVRVV